MKTSRKLDVETRSDTNESNSDLISNSTLLPDVANAETLIAELGSDSQSFVGSWNRVISTTNWEKGRIICEWRNTLQQTYSQIRGHGDEAWSQLVGGITPQHVGRLRRVFERFGTVYANYDGLYWSHFQAATDWADAELWLEGAVQNRWSVSEMRRMRWETLGAVESQRPQDADIVPTEPAEESAVFADSADPLTVVQADSFVPSSDEASEAGPDSDLPDGSATEPAIDEIEPSQVQPSQPFKDLPELPEDLAEAFESLKLAILRHKTAGWIDISLDHVLASLDALKEMARTGSDSGAS